MSTANSPAFFFSREEPREHIHVYSTNGEAKYSLKPEILLAKNYKLSDKELNEIKQIIIKNKEMFLNAWNKHFGS